MSGCPGCLSGCLCIVKLLLNRSFSRSFSPILTKLGTHVLCASMEKNCGTDFQYFSLIFCEFFKLRIGTNLWNILNNLVSQFNTLNDVKDI